MAEAGAVSLARASVLILDEADKLLKDAACSADLAALRPLLPEARQTLLLTATLPKAVTAAARSWLAPAPALLGEAAATFSAAPGAAAAERGSGGEEAAAGADVARERSAAAERLGAAAWHVTQEVREARRSLRCSGPPCAAATE